jgi:zinc finger protein 830
MADVRAMLRAEKASRSSSSRKRKAAIDSPIQPEKRSRANDEAPIEAPSLDPQTLHQQPPAEDEPVQGSSKSTDAPQSPSKAADGQPTSLPADAAPTDGVDEAEWAAFERDVAAPDPPANMSALDAIKASAMQADPVTAAELEARRKAEEQRRERDRREEEAEADREEAAQRLEDELEQMEALERRIQRLKDLREELRRKNEEEEDPPEAMAAAPPEEVGDDESDGSDDDDGWNMGFR